MFAGSTSPPGSLLAECPDAGLVVQQRALAAQAAAEPGERAVRADHAMARDDHRDRLAAVGEAALADGLRIAQLAGDRAVGGRLPVGDLPQHRPHALLEDGALRRERQVEL